MMPLCRRLRTPPKAPLPPGFARIGSSGARLFPGALGRVAEGCRYLWLQSHEVGASTQLCAGGKGCEYFYCLFGHGLELTRRVASVQNCQVINNSLY